MWVQYIQKFRTNEYVFVVIPQTTPLSQDPGFSKVHIENGEGDHLWVLYGSIGAYLRGPQG